MTDPKNLKLRIKKARAAQFFAQPMSKDSAGNVTVVRVPGSGGKYYQVILRKLPPNLVTVECRLEMTSSKPKPGQDKSLGYLNCAGNGAGSTCVHGLAAVILAGQEKGFESSWCATPESAARVTRLGGKRIEIRPHHKRENSDCSVWSVIKKEEK